MKKIIILLALPLGIISAKAQNPSGSYWVVETGRHQGIKYSIIRLYDSSNHLLASRTVQGKHLKASRPAVQHQLEKLLLLNNNEAYSQKK